MANVRTLERVALVLAGALCCAPTAALAQPKAVGKEAKPAAHGERKAAAVGPANHPGAAKARSAAAGGKLEGEQHSKADVQKTSHKASKHGAEPTADAAEHGADSAEPSAAAAPDMPAGSHHERAAWMHALAHARVATQRQHGAEEPAEGSTAAPQEEGSAAERADKHRAALRRELAELVQDGADKLQLSQELRQHARRTAQLARIRAIAERQGDDKVIARVDKLMEREIARHDAKLAHLSGKDDAVQTAEADAQRKPAHASGASTHAMGHAKKARASAKKGAK